MGPGSQSRLHRVCATTSRTPRTPRSAWPLSSVEAWVRRNRRQVVRLRRGAGGIRSCFSTRRTADARPGIQDRAARSGSASTPEDCARHAGSVNRAPQAIPSTPNCMASPSSDTSPSITRETRYHRVITQMSRLHASLHMRADPAATPIWEPPRRRKEGIMRRSLSVWPRLPGALSRRAAPSAMAALHRITGIAEFDYAWPTSVLSALRRDWTPRKDSRPGHPR
jgi:hypothetical protein